MIYEVLVEASFVARHGILLPSGVVEPAHEHEWRVIARFIGNQLDSCGLLVDFEEVQADLEAVLADLRGADLNRCPAMRGLNPTAEYVAQVILEGLHCRRGDDPRLFSIAVTEAPGCVAVCALRREIDDDRGAS